jgi:hypothetical protein
MLLEPLLPHHVTRTTGMIELRLAAHRGARAQFDDGVRGAKL